MLHLLPIHEYFFHAIKDQIAELFPAKSTIIKVALCSAALLITYFAISHYRKEKVSLSTRISETELAIKIDDLFGSIKDGCMDFKRGNAIYTITKTYLGN